MSATKHHNRLANATSPYLQQHADNPVDWYPWSEEALERARKEDKPILLSIGYAACHWCHVMAHESFEDEETAAVMNELFINIKVDREERPDLDKIYQICHQLLTGRGGGWPLTLFLSPEDQTPYFAGTYFPVETNHGLPGFKDILRYMANAYATQRADIATQNIELHRALSQLNQLPKIKEAEFNLKPLELAEKNLARDFDKVHGGFGGAPKFPHSNFIELLLTQTDQHASEIIKTSLDKMAQGGIYDQIGGGFFRYSVDEKWRIPHFEKMLYDNAQLLENYVHAFQVTQNPYYAKIATETANWVLTDMASPDGGYYATLDADSKDANNKSHEGAFYYWDREQVKKLLTDEEFVVCELYYGLNLPANFEGHWHLYVAMPLEKDAQNILDSARQKLLTARKQRPHPGCDNKIITAWNGMMIKALALAGDILKRPEFLQAAERSLDFIRNKMFRNQQLFSCYKDGKAYQTGFLDDYAFLLAAVLQLWQIHKRDEDLQFAIALGDILLDEFYDVEQGGFFFTPHDYEKILFRPRTFEDEAIPAGNGIAVLALLQLSQITKDDLYHQAAIKTLEAVWPQLCEYPQIYCSLLLGLRELLENRGKTND